MKIVMRLIKRYDKNGKLLSFYVEINRRRKSLHTKDETAAQRAFRRIKREALAGKVASITGKCTKTLGQFRDEYVAWAEHGVEKTTTRRANILGLTKLIEAAGESIKLDRISQHHIDIMIANCRRKGNKTGAINNYIRHAKAVIKKAAEWGYVKASPLANVRQIRQEKRLPGFVRKGDLNRLLAGIKDPDLRLYITAYLATGRRRSELLGLDWMDISFDAGRYIVRISKTNATKSRSYRINGLFRSVLESIGPRNSGPVFERWRHPDTVSHRVKEALVIAGYGHLTLHSLRHTYASLMAADGRTLLEIQRELGHKDIKATMIYTHLCEDDDGFEVNIGPVDLEVKK